MQFKQLFALGALALSAGQASAALTATEVVVNINIVTEKSSSANKNAMSIGLLNFFTTAPRLVNDFRGIIQVVTEDINAMATVAPSKARRQAPGYTGDEQTEICAAFRGFVQVHQALLNTVIGKHGILSLTPFTVPIAEVLRELENVVDTLAFGIIDAVPTCATGATRDKDALDNTIDQAIIVYAP